MCLTMRETRAAQRLYSNKLSEMSNDTVRVRSAGERTREFEMCAVHS